MTVSVVTDITDRIAARAAVVPLQREPGEVVPLRSRHTNVDAHVDAQVEALLCAIVQADSFANHPAASEADQVTRRTEISAYGHALGIAIHPNDPAWANAVKRAVLGSLAAGIRDIEDLTAIVLGNLLPPQAG